MFICDSLYMYIFQSLSRSICLFAFFLIPRVLCPFSLDKCECQGFIAILFSAFRLSSRAKVIRKLSSLACTYTGVYKACFEAGYIFRSVMTILHSHISNCDGCLRSHKHLRNISGVELTVLFSRTRRSMR